MERERVPFRTVVECLRLRAAEEAEKVAYTFLADGKREAATFTYGGLDEHARAIAGHLQSLGAAGERALLLYPPGLDVVAAFYGCLYAGAAAVPLPPPDPGRLKWTLSRLRTAIRDARASVVLTSPAIYAAMSAEADAIFAELPELATHRWIVTTDLGADPAEPWQPRDADPEEIAFIQYTSGSTSSPKGVMVRHRHLAHNAECLRQSFGYGPDSIAVTWMPYFHDYGLVEGIVQPLWSGIPTYLMSPLAFLKRPIRWLEAISRYRATHSHGPCFAFERCVEALSPRHREGLDLSSWRVATVGAEPVREDVLRAFARAFAPFGFRPEAFAPGFGMAEATLGVTLKPPSTTARVLALDAGALRAGRALVRRVQTLNGDGDGDGDGDGGAGGERLLVSCGRPMMEDIRLAIVDPETSRRVAPDVIGELWIASPSAAAGYHERPEETLATFHARIAGEDNGPWLRTGDLGFLHEGELAIAGRLKDMLIFRGENHYPQDIEASVARCHRALQANGCAAFGVEDGGEERLVVVQAVDVRSVEPPVAEAIFRAVRHAVADEHGLEVWAIALLPAGGVTKTTSGKIARRENRQRFIDGSLEALALWRMPATASGATPPDATPPEDPSREVSPEGLLAWLGRWLRARGKVDAPALDPGASLLDYGVDSVTAVEVSLALEEHLGGAVALDPGLAWRFPDLASLARHVAERAASPGAGDAAATPDEGINLHAEAELDPSIRPEMPWHPSPAAPRRILLTGATGFVGAFLLDEILRTTDAHVECLVRARGQEHGRERIEATLRGYGLFREEVHERVELLAGDLTQPLLGLSAPAFDAAAARIDAIFHAGSIVHFVYPYAALRACNVQGTVEILRLASRGRPKPVHYVSSFSAVAQASLHPEREVGDLSAAGSLRVYDLPYAQRKLSDIGYVQAKRVTDLLVRAAQERGLPIATYRPAYVSGHSASGTANLLDYVSRLLKGCILLGAAPAQSVILNTAPVDYVARAIVHLASRPDTPGHGFDILNPRPMAWNDLVSFLRGRGYAIQTMEPERWREHVLSHVRSPEHPLFGLLPLLAHRPADRLLLGYPTHFRGPQLMADLTTGRVLEGTGILCPPVDDRLLDTYLRYFVERGFLAPPTRAR